MLPIKCNQGTPRGDRATPQQTKHKVPDKARPWCPDKHRPWCPDKPGHQEGPRGQGWGQLTAIKWQQEPTPSLHKGVTKRILRWQQVHWQWYGPHPPHCLLQLKWPLTTPLKWFTTNCLLRQFVTSRGVFKRALSRHWINSTFAQTFDVFDPGPLLLPKYGEDTKL